MSELKWRDVRVDPPKEGELCMVRYPVLFYESAIAETMVFEKNEWRVWNTRHTFFSCVLYPYYLPMPEESNDETE